MIKKLRNRLIEKKQEKLTKKETEKQYKELLTYQAKFLKTNDEYDSFCYFLDDGEAPVFITRTKSDGKGHSFGSFVYAVTPRMLEHCVEHLTHEAKVLQANNIEAFEEKCKHLAEVAKYQEESWEECIDAIIVYLAQFRTKGYNN